MTKSLAALLFAATVLAALPPYDFTGHWNGAIAFDQAPGFLLMADFTSTGAKTFTGTISTPGNGPVSCEVRGKRKRKVRLRITCVDSTRIRSAALLDVGKGTIAGAARLSKGGRHFRGFLSLTRAQSAQTTTTQPGGTTTTTIVATGCGNGAIDTGEQCDDGNTQGGDGCSATCAIERTVLETEVNDGPEVANEAGHPPVIVQGTVQPGSDLDFFSFVVGASGAVTLETFNGTGFGSCDANTDTYLELWDPNKTIISENDNGDLNPCSKVVKSGLSPGVYFACVRSPYGITVVPAYQLVIRSP